MIHRFESFARRQPREDLARQISLAWQDPLVPVLGFALTYGGGLVFLPVWTCLALGLVELGGQALGLRLMRHLDPGRQPRRYLAMLLCLALAEGAHSTLAVLVWQQEAPLAKAYALGLAMLALMRLTSARSLHRTLIWVRGGVLALAVGSGLIWDGLSRGKPVELAICGLGTIGAAVLGRRNLAAIHRLRDEITDERLVAQAADQAKARFLAQMSHELRTPLNAILGMGTAELAQAGTAASRERLAILLQSGRGLSVMLDDILDLSAVQAGQLPIRPRPLNLAAEIASTVAMFRQQAEDSGLTLRFTIQDDMPGPARLDGQRLRQCLSNILSNAIKHSPSGMVSVFAYLSGPDMVAIKVSDSGPGVPEAMREKIFEPFYRGPTDLPGAGLGMAIARTLARRMGGDLTLLPSSAGAHFLLTLAFEPAAAAELPRPEATPGQALAGLRVLVVDDIATNRLVAATYLRLLGAEAVEASSGPEALQILQGPAPPQMVLLDLLMPGMDGQETLRRIRALPGPVSALPVVAMSAEPELVQSQIRPGFDSHMAKPLSAETIAKVLRALRPPPPVRAAPVAPRPEV